MNNLTRGILAELVGTFVLVFVGGFAVVVVNPPYSSGDVVIPALAHGLILVGLIFAYGHISGAQFNPAVTLGLLIGGKQDLMTSVVFMITQFIGGILAAYAIVLIMPDPGGYGQTIGSLTEEYVWRAALFEVFLTFFLVSAVYQSAVFEKAGINAALAIGLTLAASILAGGVFTGASLNPARTLGPALAASGAGIDISYVLPYLVGIFGGGAIAGLFHAYVLPSDND